MLKTSFEPDMRSTQAAKLGFEVVVQSKEQNLKGIETVNWRYMVLWPIAMMAVLFEMVVVRVLMTNQQKHMLTIQTLQLVLQMLLVVDD